MSDDQGTDFRPLKIVSYLNDNRRVTYFNAIYGLSFGRLRSEIRQHLNIKPTEYTRIMQRNTDAQNRFNFDVVNAKNRKREMPYHYFSSFGSEIIIDRHRTPNRKDELWIFVAFESDLNDFRDFQIAYKTKITYKQFLIKAFEVFNKDEDVEHIENKYVLKEYKYDSDDKNEEKKWGFVRNKDHATLWREFQFLLESNRELNEFTYQWRYHYQREVFNTKSYVLSVQ